MKNLKEAFLNVGLFLLRIMAGTGIAYHGYGKVFGGDITMLIQGVTKMGFPMPDIFAWAAALSEFLGGIMIVLGLYTRVGAFFVFACLLSTAPAYAGSNQYGFDDNLRYDIYFAGRDSDVSVIRNVVIQEVRDIGGKKFYIIRPQGFKLDETLGFVALDAVLAILPQNSFTVRRISGMKVD